MKKVIKLAILFIVTFLSLFVFNGIVSAGDSSPKTFKAKTNTLSPKPLGLTQNISVKLTTDGKYIYCYDVNKRIPNSDVLYTKGDLITNSVISNIIASGYSDKTDNEFFATQAALWIYLFDNGMMKDTSKDYIQDIKDAINGSYSNNAIAKDIKNILSTAKSSGATKGSLDITSTSSKFTLSNGTFTSDVIKVSTNLGDYKVTLSNAPTGSKVNYVSGGFTISVPAANASVGTTSIKATVSDSYTKYNTYKYNPNDSVYQIMLASYPETVSLSDSISVSLTKEAEKKVTVVEISKQDKSTKKELAGATLVIKNSAGTVVKTWKSTTSSVKYSDLAVGTYTLEETAAPSGYRLNSEKITFEVKKDNGTKKLTIYNEQMKPTVVEISKQDKSTKKELAGATLVIKNSAGTVVKTWKSTTSSVKFSDLAAGAYTLEETVSPSGYALNTEKISFKVANDDKSIKLTIFNEKKDPTVIEISKQDITNKEELPGATLVIKDSKGNVLHKWVSSKTPKQFSNLAVGTYTLEETIAPDGYTLSTEKIKFTVKNDGKIEKVIMYNEPKDVTTITISKQDITNKTELPGATLVIKDINGKVIEQWVSTDKPKLFTSLREGKYILEETIAPEGYELSTERITFEVKKDGKIDTVIMYNTPKSANLVSISKQDITNKTELPGATLIIRDINGVELHRWVSTNAPYLISDLKVGTYTLEEIIAPEGFELSSEKITFEVKEDNLITKVVMYNTPVKTETILVPITSAFSTISYIIGGIGMIGGALLLYKNAKKEM